MANATAPLAAEQQLLDVDGTVFIMLGIFLVTMFVLTQGLWKPYLRVKEQRTLRIDGYREEAVLLEQEASARLARVEAQLAEARREGSLDRAKARASAEAKEQELVAKAQEVAQRSLTEARTRIDAAFASEMAKLKDRAAALGREIAEKVLGRKAA